MKERLETERTRELLALLRGELEGERERQVRRRLEIDDRLKAELERLEAVWEGLELPPVDPAPPGFTAAVTARVFAQESTLVPVWFRDTLPGRLASTAALAGGIVLGVLVAYPQESTGEVVDLLTDETSLAESYWQTIAESDIWGAEQP